MKYPITPKRYPCPNLWNLWLLPLYVEKKKKGLYRCDYVKEFEMRRLSWNIRQSLNVFFQEGSRGFFTIQTQEKKAMSPWRQTWQQVLRMLAATKNWKRWRMNYPLELSEGAWNCQHPHFGPLILIFSFWSPEVWETIFKLPNCVKL